MAPKTRPHDLEQADAHNEEGYSPAVENYLLALYDLQEEHGHPTPTQLAGHLRHFPHGEGLGTSLPSVTGMIRRLQKEGLVLMDKNKHIRLTPRGTEAGAGVARRHHLAECLAVDVLGVDLASADEEAHRLEHYISPEIQERISDLLETPKVCPYGRPIPNSGYKKPSATLLPLDQTTAGRRYRIAQLPEDDKRLVGFLSDHHLIPGQLVRVQELASYRDSIVLEIDGEEVSIGYRVAEVIHVLPEDADSMTA